MNGLLTFMAYLIWIVNITKDKLKKMYRLIFVIILVTDFSFSLFLYNLDITYIAIQDSNSTKNIPKLGHDFFD